MEDSQKTIMKKIPTLFIREFADHTVISISSSVTPGMEWVLEGEGIATEKIDGSCCAIIDSKFYIRYDAKKDKHGIFKKPPEGAIPCDEPDPVTGHWPHWSPAKENDPGVKWYLEAKRNTEENSTKLSDGTYEAIGPHFQNNPYRLEKDILVRHGEIVLDVERSFEGIRQYLTEHNIEGIVFWKDGKPQCKIKRKDFGLKWPEIIGRKPIP